MKTIKTLSAAALAIGVMGGVMIGGNAQAAVGRPKAAVAGLVVQRHLRHL